MRPSHASASVLASLDRVWFVNALTALLMFVSLVVFIALHRPAPSFAAGAPDPAAAQQAGYSVTGSIDVGDAGSAFDSSDAQPTAGSARSSSAVGGGPTSALAADGIPETALLAYQQAAQWENGIDPGCGITWPLLAAIGRVESDHGRFAGATLHTDGTSTPPVIGIPLDGNGTALILDTDRGRLDGDTVYDRAVGPMQFIPSTWVGYGVDADHNGTADPFDIFDAAAAAARYLCAASSLTTQAGQVRAVLAYNHSDAYVAEVLALEATYAAGGGVIVPVTAGPVSTATTQQPPKIPPVNPGPPLGVGSPPSSTSASASASSGSAPSSTPGPSESTTGTPTDDNGPSTTQGPVVTPPDTPTDPPATDPSGGSSDTGDSPDPVAIPSDQPSPTSP